MNRRFRGDFEYVENDIETNEQIPLLRASVTAYLGSHFLYVLNFDVFP